MTVDLSEMKTKTEEQAISYEEFLRIDKTEDLCFEVADGKISDDIEDYFSELDWVTSEDDIKAAINSAKQVKIYEKARYKLPKGILMEWVTDYLTDNFGFDTYEQDTLDNIVGEELFNEFEEKINKEISHLYTSYVGNYIMDISKEVEEYLKEELGEDFPEAFKDEVGD